IQLRDDQHITFAHRCQRLRESWPLAVRTREPVVGVDILRRDPELHERFTLRGSILVSCTAAGVAYFHDSPPSVSRSPNGHRGSRAPVELVARGAASVQLVVVPWDVVNARER